MRLPSDVLRSLEDAMDAIDNIIAVDDDEEWNTAEEAYFAVDDAILPMHRARNILEKAMKEQYRVQRTQPRT